MTLLEEGYLARLNFNKNGSKPNNKNNGCFKDFTLTNVRQTAKLIEIKQAIEKLKGYRIECQTLMLFDEIELTNGKNP